MRRWLIPTFLLAALPLWAQSDRDTKPSDTDILFNEVIPIAAEGAALDVSFAQGNLEVVQMNRAAWILDPRLGGLHVVACRPIPETAKAGETLTLLGEQRFRGGEALHVREGQGGALVLTSRGTLLRLVGGQIDSVAAGAGLATAVDVDANPSGLLAVLWGKQVRVFLDFGREPFLEFPVEDDLMPAVAVAVSAGGQVFVAGRGSTAVAAYEPSATGKFERRHQVSAAELSLQRLGGMDLSPFMLLPAPGREGWADQDHFVVLSDAEAGGLLVLDRTRLRLLGRWDLRGQLPGVAPGRLDVSNRGQIGIVDQRSGAAHVLPTSVMVAMVQGAEGMRWRVLEETRTFRVQGGDTLQLPDPRHE